MFSTEFLNNTLFTCNCAAELWGEIQNKKNNLKIQFNPDVVRPLIFQTNDFFRLKKKLKLEVSVQFNDIKVLVVNL